MSVIGRVVSVLHYPVKSMAGEVVERAYLNDHGLQHDRLYAFESSGAPPGMLRLTSRERREMLRYRPRVLADGSVEVMTPTGERYPVDSPEMLRHLLGHIPQASVLSLTCETTPQTDVRPLALLGVETAEAFSAEMNVRLDPQRFRANFLLTMNAGPFAEEALVGRTIGIGGEARLLIRERIPRCRFITYDPAAPHIEEPLFVLMKLLERRYQGRAGIYASVLRPGWITCGDEVYEIGPLEIDDIGADMLRSGQ